MFKPKPQTSEINYRKLILFWTFFSFYGLIHSQDLVDYQLVDIECINTLTLRKSQFVINSPTEFMELRKNRFDGRKFGINCKGLPRIDFNKYTLIGYIVSTGGCTQPEYTFEFTNEAGEYTLTSYVSTTGSCRMSWTEFYWIVTKKIHSDAIKFELIYE